MNSIPTGTVTFLFTDIEASTRHWEAQPAAMNAALSRHDSLLRSSIGANHGYVFKTVGDAFCAAFSTPLDGLKAAIQAQYALQQESWPRETGAIRTRMALYVGATEEREGDYFGPPVNRVARILSAGHGGQVLLSEGVYALVRDALPTGVQILDLGEHRLKDLSRPERLFQISVPGLPSEFPPLSTLDTHPNNLPSQATPMIGREKELHEIEKLLARQDVHLLTLTGPGGIGKTRLSLQVAADMLEEFEDGAWLVELSALQNPRLILSTIAQGLGLKETAGQPPVQMLKQYLQDKHLLLLLDNFEQVSEAAGDVGRLVADCSGLKVLAASRLPLRIRGEHEHTVPPLSMPTREQLHRPGQAERLTQYEAVRLFIDRAQAVKDDFEVNNDNAPEVAEICVRLDGLPLAIELAAARIRLFAPQALLGRLQHSLKLLTGGARDLPARQRTLRGAIEWSYDLLTEGEQQFFRRMAVFNGGRSLEALEAVCNYDGQLEVDVLDGVESLVEKSLLQQREGRDGEPRFWMLETIHEYATEKLEESGEAEELVREHVGYFLALAEGAEWHLTGSEQLVWLDRLEDEHDNLRAALRRSLDNLERASDGKTAQQAAAPAIEPRILHALKLAAAITWFWYFRGYLCEGRGWMEKAVAHVAEAGQTAVAGKALNALGVLAFVQNDLGPARDYLERALVIWRELNDRRGIAFALTFLARVLAQQGDSSGALLAEEGAAIFEEIDDRWGRALSLDFLGELARDKGDDERATRLHDESLALYREMGHQWGVALELSSFGTVALCRGDYAAAQQRLEEAVAIQREVGDKLQLAWTLRSLADVVRHMGDRQRGEELFTESEGLLRELGRKREDQATEPAAASAN